jgi:glutathione S-transferase
MACCLAWIVLRFGRDFAFATRPALARWYDGVAARPSMTATDPGPQ